MDALRTIHDPFSLLNDVIVRAALRAAWNESNPGVFGGHEEGGFICLGAEGDFPIDRWPLGQRAEIFPPPHSGGKRNGEIIVASFHTHPNTGNTFFQEPSPGDCDAVRNDPDLKHPEYIGEFVLSQDTIYLIYPDGGYIAVGATQELLKERNNDQ